MRKEQEKFKDFLRGRNLKMTSERAAILNEIVRCKRHFNADDLYGRIRKKQQKVSRASIYRTIPLLLESGLIEEIKTIGTHTYYEFTYGRTHHDHLICLACGEVIEFYSGKLEQLKDDVCKKENFNGLRHLLEIQGYCKSCVSRHS